LKGNLKVPSPLEKGFRDEAIIRKKKSLRLKENLKIPSPKEKGFRDEV
jgi:hypothetical protein